jgi:hypothetical protein
MGVKTYRKKSSYLGETSTEVFKQMFVHLQYALNTDKNVVCFTETHSW